MEAPQEIHADVVRLTMTEQTPFILRMRGDRWSSVQEFVKKTVNTGGFGRRSRQALETLTADGPVVAILDELGVQSIDGVDQGRSLWMTSGVVGAEEPVRAASVGLPWLPESTDPSARFIRLIVPVDDPVAAAKSVEMIAEERGAGGGRVEPKAEQVAGAEKAAGADVAQPQDVEEPQEPTLDDKTRVLPLERHIQIDVLELLDPRNQSVTQELWDKLDAGKAQTTETPAQQAFLQSTGPVSFYARATQLRQFGAALLAFETGKAIRRSTPENRQRMRARGGALTLNLHMMAPASQREFEDFALLGRSTGEAGLRVDLVATRTQVGRQVYEKMNLDVSLPMLNEEALPQESLLADLSWQGDFAAAATLLDDAGIDLAEPEDKVSLDEMLNGAVNIGQLLSNVQNLKWTARSMGPWGPVGLAYSPTYLPRLGLSQLSDDLQGLLPVAVRVRLIEPADAQQSGAPGVGAMVVRFNTEVDVLGGVIKRHAKTIDRAKGVGVTHRIVAAPDGAAELHIAVGMPIDDVVMAERTSVPSGVSVGVRESDAQNSDGDMLGLASALGDWHLRAAHSPTVARWTLVSRAGALMPEALEARGEPAQNPPACLDELVLEGMNFLEGLQSMPIAPTLAEVGEATASYDAAAAACTKAAPEHAERIRWATARARWLLAHRSMHHVLERTQQSIDHCKMALERAKRDDSRACSRLTRNWRRGNHGEKLQRAYLVATTLLEEACERGDQIACKQKGEVPAVSTLTWRPETK
jgi:hypothetical protein